jgi:signal transduction histidine kinase
MKRKLEFALIQQALLRWENAVLIALAILLTAFFRQPFDFWPEWGWGALALVGVIAITLSSLGEREVQSAAIDDLLYEEYNPAEIKTANLRAIFLQSLKYRSTIERMVNQSREGVVKTRLSDLADKVKQWIAYIYELARVLDDYQRDPMLNRDPAAIQTEMTRIQANLARETNPSLVNESKNLLASKQKHLQSSAALKDKMQGAAMQLEQSMDAMATIYTQFKLLETRGLEDISTQAIDHDIDEQVNRMGDLIDGLQKAYQEGKA